MGAWGVGIFDNDTACGWASKLERSRGIDAVREAIGRTLAVGNHYLTAALACEAFGACEVIARLKGNWGPRNPYTERLDSWVASHQMTPQAALVEAAVSAIDRNVAHPSELLQQWSEGADCDAWLESVRDLRNRVRGSTLTATDPP
jgi:Domain of unknown function (DUF4259)